MDWAQGNNKTAVQRMSLERMQTHLVTMQQLIARRKALCSKAALNSWTGALDKSCTLRGGGADIQRPGTWAVWYESTCKRTNTMLGTRRAVDAEEAAETAKGSALPDTTNMRRMGSAAKGSALVSFSMQQLEPRPTRGRLLQHVPQSDVETRGFQLVSDFQYASTGLNVEIARRAYALVCHVANDPCRGFFSEDRSVAEEKFRMLQDAPYATALFNANGQVLHHDGRYNLSLECKGANESLLVLTPQRPDHAQSYELHQS